MFSSIWTNILGGLPPQNVNMRIQEGQRNEFHPQTPLGRTNVCSDSPLPIARFYEGTETINVDNIAFVPL